MVNAIGIDLGTSKCCVGVFRDGEVEVIPNEFENDTTPSFFAFTPVITIGEAAKNKLRTNPANTIFAALRLIGRKFKELVAQSDMKCLPFRVSFDKKGRPMIKEARPYSQKYYPEEVVAMLLVDLKLSAEIYLGTPVKDVVITVPADLNHCYHQAIRDAAQIAGLNVLRVVNAPAAAAIAHIVAMKDLHDQDHLVFDFGAGTLDVSIISGNANRWEVKSTVSNHHLGGEDVTNRLFDYLKVEFERKHGYAISNSASACIRLRAANEKKRLYPEEIVAMLLVRLKQSADAFLEADVKDVVITTSGQLDLRFRRAIFDAAEIAGLCYDLFQRIWGCLQKALDDACLENCEIDDAILLGGSSHIPVVQKMLSEYFVNAKLIKTLNTDEAAASGAAIQAALLSGDESEDIQGLLIPHVVPLPLGIQENEEMLVFIEEHVALPVTHSKLITATYDNDNKIVIEAFEGVIIIPEYNTLLGKIKFNKIPRLPDDDSNSTKVEVTFQVDVTGTITVSATDKSTGKTATLTIPDKNSRFSEEELLQMTESINEYISVEKIRRQNKAAKDRLTAYCNRTMKTVEENKRKRKALTPEDEQAYKKCKDALVWIDRNPRAEAKDFQRQLEEAH
uniref:Heat shock 70 kDa protein 14 n=1 Tax=Panagrellus redivivus TaxID=6233 RepID=A0A7E4UUT9_PANRE